MASQVTHVRLAPQDLAFIDEAVERGRFLDRTDFIRSAVRLQIHELAKERLRESRSRRRSPTPIPDLLASLRASRKAVHREIWG
ncbi:MAG TPA: ribbon-helix-helix domain-containing protein [Thermoplasmata archaeon]|nr:ribbon-helix-helix domain-containing protein [Thermoplasmata archaeon]